jgi:hypothetical protein
MKSFVGIFLIFFLPYFATAQRFPIDTLQWNGADRINLVILGDGYTAAEMDKLVDDVRRITFDAPNAFFSYVPYKNYQNYFNVFLIRVPSNVSGAADNPNNLIDNYFGSAFGSGGVARVLSPLHHYRINNVLASNFPNHDIVAMIVNDPRYGGSGGRQAVFSTHHSAPELFLHEVAHTFVGLSDEYWAGDMQVSESANMTRTTNSETVRWRKWYGDSGIGIYPHGTSGSAATWFKPSRGACMMERLDRPFCPVCVQATIQEIQQRVPVMYSHSPTASRLQIGNNPIRFSVGVVEPTPNTIRVTWTLNDSVVASNANPFTVHPSSVPTGGFLNVTVQDTTTLVRIDTDHVIHLQTFTWEILRATTSIEYIPVSPERMSISLYPNPVQDYLNIEFKQEQNQNLRVEIMDMMGRRLISQRLVSQPKNSINLSRLQAGHYVVNLYSGQALVATTKIVKR